MTYPVYPSLMGLSFDVVWTPEFMTVVNRAASGKETSIRFWNTPIRNYQLTYDILRFDLTNAELQNLLGFFNSVYARGNVFLFTDPDDYTVTGQSLGTGDGATVAFQLQRTLGGFAEPILAPNTVSAVKVSSVALGSSQWSVSSYGSSAPGIVTLSTAPASSAPVTADFTYYFPCRFSDDKMDFNKFMYQMWEAKKVTFYTQK